jgi:hypothetical protein
MDDGRGGTMRNDEERYTRMMTNDRSGGRRTVDEDDEER